MVNLDYTLFIQVINFLVLIYILNVLLYKPILRILDHRKERITKSEDEVKDLNLTIEKRMAQYEEKIQQAKLEAMAQRNEILQEGASAAKETIDAARNEIAGMIGQFQQKLNAEMEQARDILHNQSRSISLEIAGKVLGRNIQ